MNAWKTKLATALLGAALLGSAASPQPAAAQSALGGGRRVLVVGDSLELLSSPYLKSYLPGVPITVNVGGGYNSFQIFDLFQEAYDPSQSVIVFDAGTNDNPAYPEILAGNLAKAAAIAGNRCFVVPTIHGYTVNGVNNDGKNKVVAAFAASRPGTQVPDWAGFEAAHPELMQSDDLHPTAAGADARARLIAQGIAGCLASAPTSLSSPPGSGPNAARATARRSAPPPAPKVPPAKRLARTRALTARLVATEVLRHAAKLLEGGRSSSSTMDLLLVAALFTGVELAPTSHAPRRAGARGR